MAIAAGNEIEISLTSSTTLARTTSTSQFGGSKTPFWVRHIM
jgi:hypothetical protein